MRGAIGKFQRNLVQGKRLWSQTREDARHAPKSYVACTESTRDSQISYSLSQLRLPASFCIRGANDSISGLLVNFSVCFCGSKRPTTGPLDSMQELDRQETCTTLNFLRLICESAIPLLCHKFQEESPCILNHRYIYISHLIYVYIARYILLDFYVPYGN